MSYTELKPREMHTQNGEKKKMFFDPFTRFFMLNIYKVYVLKAIQPAELPKVKRKALNRKYRAAVNLNCFMVMDNHEIKK